jgi:hypothetical protein
LAAAGSAGATISRLIECTRDSCVGQGCTLMAGLASTKSLDAPGHASHPSVEVSVSIWSSRAIPFYWNLLFQL